MLRNEETAERIVCPGCFRDKEDVPVCAACGFDERVDRPSCALPYRTVLNSRFMVGRVLFEPDRTAVWYLGWDIVSGNLVVVSEFFPRMLVGRESGRKSVLPHTVRDGEVFDRCLSVYLEDVRRITGMDHPNLVQVREVFEANGTGYLITDHFDGELLATYLDENGKMSAEEAVALMMPLFEGLETLHRASLVHGDISPRNIVLTRDEGGIRRLVLLGFGMAHVREEARRHMLPLILEPGYAPGEQYLFRGNVGPWTDVYACAAVLYRMVTGLVPPDAVSRLIDDQLLPPSSLGVTTSPDFEFVLMNGLDLRMENRPRSAHLFRTHLLEVFVPQRFQGLEPDSVREKARLGDVPGSSENGRARPIQESRPPAMRAGNVAERLRSGDLPYSFYQDQRAARFRRVAFGVVGLLVIGLVAVGMFIYVPDRTNNSDRQGEVGRSLPPQLGNSIPEAKEPEPGGSLFSSVDVLFRSADSLSSELDELERLLEEGERRENDAPVSPVPEEEITSPEPEESAGQEIEDAGQEVERKLLAIREDVARAENLRRRGIYAQADRLYLEMLGRLEELGREATENQEIQALKEIIGAAQTQNRQACEVEIRIAIRRGETPPVCQ